MNSDEILGSSRASQANHARHLLPHKTGPRLPKAPDGPIGLPLADSIPFSKKTVLLVDSNLPSRESRARVMRARGVHVDCVATTAEAWVRLAAETYNLILVDPGRKVEAAESLVHEIRTRNSHQLVRFLVGSPQFVAESLNRGNSRLQRAKAPAPGAVSDKPRTLIATGVDFGQQIRDAEAEQTP